MIMPIPIKNNNVETITKNNKLISKGARVIVNSPPAPMIFGKENNVPKKVTAPLAKAISDKANTLPKTKCLLLIGVNNKEAKVPLSFSPAIVSGHKEATVENKIEIVSIGKTKNMIRIAVLSFVPTLGGTTFPFSLF